MEFLKVSFNKPAVTSNFMALFGQDRPEFQNGTHVRQSVLFGATIGTCLANRLTSQIANLSGARLNKV